MKYNGWGGLSDAFDSWKWEKEYDILEKLLTEDEFETAQASTTTSFYTPPSVIRFIYSALEQMGFTGGRIIDPALGIGHFFGLMPDHIVACSKLTGIEIDSLSGRIAHSLYPAADIRIEGFQDSKLPDGFYDVAVTNVPFADVKLYDPKFKKRKFAIHDYYFAKALEVVRPGGIIAFVTSRYTMDKEDSSLRDYVFERAHFLGAVRLPAGAFKEFANTEVVADVIFLQKRIPGDISNGIDWRLTTKWTPQGSDDEHSVSEYFLSNPHMIAGILDVTSSRYGEDITVVPNKKGLEKSLKKALSYLPKDIISNKKVAATHVEEPCIPAPDYLKNGAFVIQDGKLYRNDDGNLEL